MKSEMRRLTDLHCHILPGIDDGASDLSVTEQLLNTEKFMGVGQIAFTPHFYADRITPEEFLARRAAAFEAAAPLCDEKGIKTMLGAEVRMVPQLLDMELRPMCLGDTDYLLLEWPFAMYPVWGRELFDQLLDAGIKPIFAHIERYDYFYTMPSALDPFIQDGALCQINAGAVLHSATQKNAFKLIRQGYVHVISSDTHNMEKRPPRLGEAYDMIEKKLGRKTADRMAAQASAVFEGKRPDAVQPPKRGGFWGLFG